MANFYRIFHCWSFILLLSLHLSISLRAQSSREESQKFIPQVLPQSPNVAALGTFSNYESNLFTGMPNISIPLYRIEYGDLTIPITLTYNATGIKVKDQSSFVGLGWSLNSGGVISRSVQGLKDEDGTYLSSPINIIRDQCNPTDQYFMDGIEKGFIDGEPDVFAYSLPGGKSGRFILQPNSTVYLIPYEPVSIQPSIEDQQLNEIQIKDENGISYLFGKDNEVTQTDRASSLTFARSAWMLSKMVSPTSFDAIEFTYQDGGTIITTDESHQILVIDAVVDPNGNIAPPATGDFTTAQVTPITSYISQVIPKDIFFENGRVEFIISRDPIAYTGSQKYLQKINVWHRINNKEELLKSITFHYSYFKIKENDNMRDHLLKLEGLEFKDKNSITIQKYSFDYHTNDFSWQNSGLNGYGIDFWGFFNGEAGNQNLIPKQTSFVTNSGGGSYSVEIGGAINRYASGTYRDPKTKLYFAEEGVLKRIHFPTGGYTEFDYEPHQFVPYSDSEVKYAGGLRILSITDFDGIHERPVSTKSYKYGWGETGVGKINLEPNISYFNSEQNFIFIFRTNKGEISRASWRSRGYFSNPIAGTVPYEGSAVYYPYAVEYYGTNENNIGKISYQFYERADENYQDHASGIVYRSSLSWQRGQLHKKVVYNKNNEVVSETSHFYSSFMENRKPVGSVVHKKNIYPGILVQKCSDSEYGNDVFSHGTYSFYSGAFKVTKSVETTFPGGFSKATNYTYNLHNLQVKEEIFTNSKSDTIKTSYKYPQDLQLTGDAEQARLKLIAQGRLATVLEQAKVTNASSEKVITFYKDWGNGKLLPERIEAGINNIIEPKIRFDLYENNGKLLQYTRENDIPISYIWGYNMTHPIAEVKNATIGRVEKTYTSPLHLGHVLTKQVTSPITFTPLLELDRDQTISFTYKPTRFGNVKDITFRLLITDEAGKKRFEQDLYNLEKTIHLPLPAGTYSFSYTADLYPHKDSTDGVYAQINISYQSTIVRQNVFHTSFEENGMEDHAAFTGHNIHRGPYTISLPIQPGSYTLTYWKKESETSNWSFISQTISITDSSPPGLTIGDSNIDLDEVRLYPQGAHITTYTYDPLIGMTSSTDSNNVSTCYEYDAFGRLKNTRDKNKNILKALDYQYQAPLP